MDRRRFLLTSLAGVLALPRGARAQRAGSVYRIGVLFPEAVNVTTLATLREGLRELGVVEGTHFAMMTRSAEGDPVRLPGLARELVDIPVDVLIAASAQASVAARGATRKIPIVAVYVFDFVKAGLVTSLARPGGNVTGLSAMASDYVGKMLQVLREVAPRARRLAVLGDPRNPSYETYWQELRSLPSGLPMTVYPVQRDDEIVNAYAAITAVPATALFVMHQPFMWVRHQQLVDLARSKGREAWRSAPRAAHEVRAGHQPQDRQGSGPHHPAVAAGAGGSSHRVVDRPAVIVGSVVGRSYRPRGSGMSQLT
jgi:putative tryptophan/tyrosine transport system substrate-binding protein